MSRARDLAAFVSNADGDIKFDTDTLFIDSSANRVAIGNTAPSRPLHITANPAMILLEDSDGGSDDKKAQVQVDSGAFEVNARNDDDSSRTDNILVADLGTGDIGISTNVPDGKLHVYNGMLQVGSKDGDTSVQQNTNSIRIAAVPNSSTEWGGLQWYREFSNYIGAEIIASRPSSAESDTDLIFKTSSTSANATERMRILNGGGLTFNGDTAAANALDDYEEGTYEHTATCTTSGTITVAGAFNTGSYVKIGNMVTAHGLMVMSAVSSPVGVLKISLPFATKNGTEREFDGAASVVINNTAGNTVGSFVALFIENDNHIYVYEGDASAYGNFAANQVQSSSLIWYSATYRSA